MKGKKLNTDATSSSSTSRISQLCASFEFPFPAPLLPLPHTTRRVSHAVESMPNAASHIMKQTCRAQALYRGPI